MPFWQLSNKIKQVYPGRNSGTKSVVTSYFQAGNLSAYSRPCWLLCLGAGAQSLPVGIPRMVSVLPYEVQRRIKEFARLARTYPLLFGLCIRMGTYSHFVCRLWPEPCQNRTGSNSKSEKDMRGTNPIQISGGAAVGFALAPTRMLSFICCGHPHGLLPLRVGRRDQRLPPKAVHPWPILWLAVKAPTDPCSGHR